MLERLKNWRKSDAQRQTEQINAYLDNELPSAQRTQFETRLADDPILQAEVEALRQVQAAIGELPDVPLPRDFALPIPAKRQAPVQRRRDPMLWPALAIALVLVMCGSLVSLSSGLLGGAAEPEIIEREVIVTKVVIAEKFVEVEGESIIVTEQVVVEKEVIVEVTVEAEREVETVEAEKEVETKETAVYRIAIVDSPTTYNFWTYYGVAYTSANKALLDDTVARLYTISPPNQTFIPHFATELPPEPIVEDDGTWSLTIPMVRDAQWSDGEPIDAHDVAFTLNACLELGLAGMWVAVCRPDILRRVEAIDDLTVRYIFEEQPTLATFHYGVAQAPILPEHAWEAVVEEAKSAENPIDVLFSAELETYPSAGGYINIVEP